MYLGAAGRSETHDVTVPTTMVKYSNDNQDKIIITLAWDWEGTDDSSNPSDTVDLKLDILNSSGNAFSPAITLTEEDVPQTTQKKTLKGTLPIGTTAFNIRGTWVAGPADGEIENINYLLSMVSQTDDDIIAGTGISVNDEGHRLL